jgi:hypothetical protein
MHTLKGMNTYTSTQKVAVIGLRNLYGNKVN